MKGYSQNFDFFNDFLVATYEEKILSFGKWKVFWFLKNGQK